MFRVKGRWESENKVEEYLVALLDQELPSGITDDDIFFYVTEEAELHQMVKDKSFLVDDFKLESYERY